MNKRLTILYQNNRNGDTWELSNIITDVRLNTYRVGRAGSLSFDVMKWEGIEWELGAPIRVETEDKKLFFGNVTKLQRTHKNFMQVTAHDQLFYLLKNKATYVFEGLKANEITAKIATEFGLKTGELVDTGYAIPSATEDGQTLLDIITRSLEKTLVHTGRMFYLHDKFGVLTITEIKQPESPKTGEDTSAMQKEVGNGKESNNADGTEENVFGYIVGEKSLALTYSLNQDIETDTFNRVKLVKDDKESGSRKAYVMFDSKNIQHWGLLQLYEKVDDSLNMAQVLERAKNLIFVKNRPTKSFSLEAIADFSVHAGKLVFIYFPELGAEFSKYFIVEACEQDLSKERMKLTLRIIAEEKMNLEFETQEL